MKLKLKVGQTEKEYEGTWNEIARFQFFEEQDKTMDESEAKFMDAIDSALYGDLVTQKIVEKFEPEDQEDETNQN